MGIFNIFKSNNSNPECENIINEEETKLDYFELIDKIDKNMYVNDDLAQKLFEKAYVLTANDTVNRHFFYNKIIEYYYGLREKQQDALDICIKYCNESIAHTPKFLKSDKDMHYQNQYDYEYRPPRIPAFQRLAIIHENEKNYKKAIKICELALSLNLRDCTKGGFEGRKNRLSKKLIKHD